MPIYFRQSVRNPMKANNLSGESPDGSIEAKSDAAGSGHPRSSAGSSHDSFEDEVLPPNVHMYRDCHRGT